MRSAGTWLGHPENPEEVSLNSVADNGGKQREGRSPRQVRARPRGAPTRPCPKGAATADTSLSLIILIRRTITSVQDLSVKVHTRDQAQRDRHAGVKPPLVCNSARALGTRTSPDGSEWGEEGGREPRPGRRGGSRYGAEAQREARAARGMATAGHERGVERVTSEMAHRPGHQVPPPTWPAWSPELCRLRGASAHSGSALKLCGQVPPGPATVSPAADPVHEGTRGGQDARHGAPRGARACGETGGGGGSKAGQGRKPVNAPP